MSIYQDAEFIKANDIHFDGVLHTVKKSRSSYQPIYEAFTNSLEAIKIRAQKEPGFKGSISVTINSRKDAADSNEFFSLTIADNGIGFNEEEFKRFNTFKDYTKGYKNLGSGRIQFAHYFEDTIVVSVFKADDKYFERNFVVSKKPEFIKNNAIVLHKYCKEVEAKEVGTRLTFSSLNERSDKYNALDEKVLKDSLIERYVHYFCYNKDNLPEITITHEIHNESSSTTKIEIGDIPSIDKTTKFSLPYYNTSEGIASLSTTGKSEEFTLDAFKISSDILQKNHLNLVSKGEVIEDSPVKLQGIGSAERVNGSSYLFLVSSDFIDSRDSNLRGELEIRSRADVSRNTSLLRNEEIFFEDIQKEVNDNIVRLYPEIREVKEKHQQNIQKLKDMFLIGAEDDLEVEISINDSEAKILEKFYEAEAKKIASIDAKIKKTFDQVSNLDPNSDDYQKTLEDEISEIVKAIPNQNKSTLTHYVARRKIVLDLFQKILDRQLKIQSEDARNVDESLIHNLLFQQGSNEPEKSDLWIIDEEFIYFKGLSETRLSAAVVDGKRLFKDEFTIEEERYLSSLGENRKIKRPDILLFPTEGKCIIIELKSPEVNVSEHLDQINMYANLILNYSTDSFVLNTFYGYLIGQSIEPRDVLGRVSSFEHSPHFDYLFRPSTKVIGFDGRQNGSIYTEVIKYSTLIQRAKLRNKIFIEKLTAGK